MITQTVDACPRCGKKHEDLKFKPLGQPAGGFNHWSTCPESKEPVLADVTVRVEGQPVAPASSAESA